MFPGIEGFGHVTITGRASAKMLAASSADSDAHPAHLHVLRAPGALYWACGTLFVLLAALGLFMVGPQVESDEGSYLLNAAAIAGRLAANPPNGYYSGYSLLLVPGFLFDASPGAAYHFALVVNALLIASIPLALWRITRQLWPETGNDVAHVIAALAATCYAPMLMLSQHTMSESALAGSFAWLLACTTTALRAYRVTAAVAAGAFAGFLFLVHARGAVMAAPILLATIVYAIVHSRSRRTVAMLWMTAIVVTMLHSPLEVAAGRDYASSAGMLREMLSRITSGDNWKSLPLNFVGSATEAIVTSLGLVVIAARAIGREMRVAWLGPERLPLRTTILAASAAAMLVALGVTAAFFSPPERADQLAYGRYALPTLIPLLAVGVLRLIVDPAQRKRDFLWAFVVGIAGLAITAAAYLKLSPAARANWNFVNSIGLYLFHGVAFPDAPWLSIALCFVTLLTVLSLAFLRPGLRGAALYAALQLTLFAAIWSTITWPGSRHYASDRKVVDAVRAFAASGGRDLCVKLAPDVDVWHRTDITWRLFPHIRAPQNSDCIEATISPIRSAHAPDQRLAAFERPSPLGNNVAIGLFLRVGTDFEDFARVVATPPDGALSPSAMEDRSADVVITNSLPLRVAVGEPLDIHVRITNRGKHPLPAIQDAQLLPYPIHLGAQADRGEEHLEYRTEIPVTIAPAQTMDAVIRVGPFDHAGPHALRIGVVQERIAWYEGAASATLEVGLQ